MLEKLKLKVGGEETYIKEQKNQPLHCSQIGDRVPRLVFVVINTTSTPKSSRYWNLYFRENCWVITALGKRTRVGENRGHPRERGRAVLWRATSTCFLSSLMPNGFWSQWSHCQMASLSGMRGKDVKTAFWWRALLKKETHGLNKSFCPGTII